MVNNQDPKEYRRSSVQEVQNFVDFGVSCVDICKALEQGIGEQELNDLSKSVRDAINLLTT